MPSFTEASFRNRSTKRFVKLTIDRSIIVEPNEPEKGSVDSSDQSTDEAIDWRTWIENERKRKMPELTTYQSKRGRGGSNSTVIEGLHEFLNEETLEALNKGKNNATGVRFNPEDYTGTASGAVKAMTNHIKRMGYVPTFAFTKAQRENVDIVDNGEVVDTLEAGTIIVGVKGKLPSTEANETEAS